MLSSIFSFQTSPAASRHPPGSLPAARCRYRRSPAACGNSQSPVSYCRIRLLPLTVLLYCRPACKSMREPEKLTRLLCPISTHHESSPKSPHLHAPRPKTSCARQKKTARPPIPNMIENDSGISLLQSLIGYARIKPNSRLCFYFKQGVMECPR